ncbi:MAG: hypothetical protein Q8862_09470 [Bacteroidota bacterium]|nr:hypothetical protein [Bacteroidota bacterium]MDP4204596.1 hypothetical protein [Bacteroidota bacterium]
MRKLNYKSLASALLVASVLAGCNGLQRMKKNANQIQFNVTPEVLEANGGNVNMGMNVKFPEKYFNKKATLVATPVLKYDGGEKAFDSFTAQGEKVQDNNKVVSYLNGGTVSTNSVLPFADEMRKSDLEVRIKATKGKKTVTFDPIKVGSGVLATSNLVSNAPQTVLGVTREKNTTGKYDPNIDAFQRIVPDEFMADIRYLVNKADVRNSEIKKAEINKLKKYTKVAATDQNKKLKDVEISAYASPEGKFDFNEKLSQKREGTATSYLKKELKKAKVNPEYKTKYTAEDWEGFQDLMQKSNIQDKDLILRVLSMYSDPEVREKEIRNLSQAFTAVKSNILPQLRRAKITTSVDLIGRTDEEILALSESDPAKLNPAELLYAATLTKDANKQKAIYTAFTRIYSNDWRGYNNLGLVDIAEGNVADAKDAIEKAEQLSKNNPVIANNLGAVALLQNDVKKAETYFGDATGVGSAADYNLGIVSLKKGKYDEAVKYFGADNSENAALAKILSGDNNSALKVLDNANGQSAKALYLKAVVAARTAKTNLMYESLQAAVKADPKVKALAKTDVEFAKFFNDAQFKAIVE